jgi:hypothetical protein
MIDYAHTHTRFIFLSRKSKCEQIFDFLLLLTNWRLFNRVLFDPSFSLVRLFSFFLLLILLKNTSMYLEEYLFSNFFLKISYSLT